MVPPHGRGARPPGREMPRAGFSHLAALTPLAANEAKSANMVRMLKDYIAIARGTLRNTEPVRGESLESYQGRQAAHLDRLRMSGEQLLVEHEGSQAAARISK